ncbi:MAG: T9SS type A sorting domain-containing protein [Niastella sp.]|uniref:T9SS type A sorting domain-containing protein n=1 Tax=Niastella sp. TaxID=1869183 RepID=UPI00389A63D8
MYTIDPATKVATYYGTISGMPVACNSVAMTADGHLYIGGGYQAVFEVTLSTLSAIQVNSSTLNVYRSGDYASCSFAVQPARVSTGGVILSDKVDPILLDQHVAIQVNPNPFLQDLTLTIQLNKAEPVRIRLIDFYGRSVLTASQKLGAGVNTLQVSVPAGLSKGIYVLELSAGNNRLLQKKLIKQ